MTSTPQHHTTRHLTPREHDVLAALAAHVDAEHIAGGPLPKIAGWCRHLIPIRNLRRILLGLEKKGAIERVHSRSYGPAILERHYRIVSAPAGEEV